MTTLPNIVNERLARLGCAIAGTDEFAKFAGTPKLIDHQQAHLHALGDALRTCWPTPVPPRQNKTRQDAIARVLLARLGCLDGASPDYLIQLVYQLNLWIDLIKAEQLRQRAVTDLDETIRTFEEMEEELHKDPNRRNADRIDGYDRDDLGDSPDF